MNLTVQQLRAFTTVARLGSFTAGARDMHLTPAALSALVRALEGEVGFALFHRSTRHVQLSEQGQHYLTHAERVLDAMRNAERMAGEIRDHRTALVRIAMTPLMHLALLPPVFVAFQRAHPHVRVDLVDIPSDRLLEGLLADEADLAVSLEVPPSDALRSELLFTSRLHAAVSVGHRLAGCDALTWAQLHGEPLILMSRAMELRVRAEVPSSAALDIRYCANNSITAFALAAGGAGIAVGPGYARPMAAVHGLRLIPLTEPEIDRRFLLYRRQHASPNAAVNTYADFLRQHFAASGAQPIELGLPA